MTLPALYTVNEVAAYFKVSIRTVRRMISGGKLSAQRVGKSLRVSEEGLLAFLRQAQTTAAAASAPVPNPVTQARSAPR